MITAQTPEEETYLCPICGQEYRLCDSPCQHSEDEWRAVVEFHEQREREKRYAQETAYQHEAMW